MDILETGEFGEIRKIAAALSGELRLKILGLLKDQSLNLNQIAGKLEIPLSTATVNVRQLEESGLINIEFKPGTRGIQKLCSLAYDRIGFIFNPPGNPAIKEKLISMPIGHFTRAEVSPPCGICTAERQLGEKDDVRVFYYPERTEAELIWFTAGFLEYRFPNPFSAKETLRLLEVSGELCSEAPFFNNSRKSDITLWINGKEIGTWTSPGDFGGKKGRYTPGWWGIHKTQFGKRVEWLVTSEGTICSGAPVSSVTLQDLDLTGKRFFDLRLGIKTDAVYKSGLNLFGKAFGNHPQNLCLRLQTDSP